MAQVNVVSFVPASVLLLFILSLLALQSKAVLHVPQILQRKPHAGMPGRLWAVHRLQAADPGYDSKVHSAQSSHRNPMAAIKPFIFYVLPSWLSYCWGEARHWSHLTETLVELIHLNYSSYMRAIAFKGTDMSLCPLPILSHQ